MITPTGKRSSKANCPTKSESRTNTAPKSPEARGLAVPCPVRRLAIGPAKKETKAMGPVAAVAVAMSSTDPVMRIKRTRSGLTPNPAAHSSTKLQHGKLSGEDQDYRSCDQYGCQQKIELGQTDTV